eukprot:CAMPEP_0206425834 /NCGR_PEP_ID=MMETSP0324_2-20121206/4024_1 /ASSEMBLY_ACC=CAM_ASM_000836 /TAXON_ID=2866 /ORGANISM="Crypthecodinium cohnii, Strain Seligo" /LENGTH=364 /DNA_ID=CAMNT_0053890685 /DNA_START=395 /DNA_END=1489 /DNA_ORIENTATION=-
MPSSAHRRARKVDENHVFDKTRICKFYLNGRCKNGAACTFAHDEAELLPLPNFFKTQMCSTFMATGRCGRAPNCSFAHSSEELRRAVKNPRVKSRRARHGQSSQQEQDDDQMPFPEQYPEENEEEEKEEEDEEEEFWGWPPLPPSTRQTAVDYAQSSGKVDDQPIEVCCLRTPDESDDDYDDDDRDCHFELGEDSSRSNITWRQPMPLAPAAGDFAITLKGLSLPQAEIGEFDENNEIFASGQSCSGLEGNDVFAGGHWIATSALRNTPESCTPPSSPPVGPPTGRKLIGRQSHFVNKKWSAPTKDFPPSGAVAPRPKDGHQHLVVKGTFLHVVDESPSPRMRTRSLPPRRVEAMQAERCIAHA